MVPHCVGPEDSIVHRLEGGWPSAPEALARVQVIVSWSVITYSASSVSLAGAPRFRRMAAYTRCLRCAGATRRPARDSGLSLRIPSWHALLYDSSSGELLHRCLVDEPWGGHGPAHPVNAFVAEDDRGVRHRLRQREQGSAGPATSSQVGRASSSSR